jgi:predicted DNA binding CopG/RHH family protein
MKGLMLMSPKERKYTERIAVFFTKEQLEQVRAEAERLGLDVSAYVRMVVMKEVNRDA